VGNSFFPCAMLAEHAAKGNNTEIGQDGPRAAVKVRVPVTAATTGSFLRSDNERSKGAMQATRLLPPPPARRGRSRAARIATLLAVGCLLASARNAPAASDPVEDLAQALQEPLPSDKAGRDARKANLMKQADRITSIVDLSRAIVLPDWRYNDRD